MISFNGIICFALLCFGELLLSKIKNTFEKLTDIFRLKLTKINLIAR